MAGESAAVGAVADNGACSVHWEVLWKEVCILGSVNNILFLEHCYVALVCVAEASLTCDRLGEVHGMEVPR